MRTQDGTIFIEHATPFVIIYFSGRISITNLCTKKVSYISERGIDSMFTKRDLTAIKIRSSSDSNNETENSSNQEKVILVYIIEYIRQA